MSTCATCGGLIMLPNVAYGYAGPVCHCQPVLHVRSGFYDQMEMVYKPRLEQLEKKAARYDWIIANALWRPGYGKEAVTWNVYMPDPNISAEFLTESSVGEELGAAIDAAIKARTA